jgi:hypothetical protein
MTQANDATWLRAQLLAAFGTGGQAHFARFLKLSGDHRPLASIVRGISNAASGRHKMSGELRALAWLLTNYEAVPDMVKDARRDPGLPMFALLPKPEVSLAPPPRKRAEK